MSTPPTKIDVPTAIGEVVVSNVKFAVVPIVTVEREPVPANVATVKVEPPVTPTTVPTGYAVVPATATVADNAL